MRHKKGFGENMDLSMKSHRDPEEVGFFPSDGCSTGEHESDLVEVEESFNLHPSDYSFELDDHARKQCSSVKTRPYQCSQCGKTFSRIQHLSEHVRIHTGERPFECLACGKTFTRERDLKNHQIVHTDAKAFHCTICVKNFALLSSLRRHVRAFHQGQEVSTEGKCLICVECGKNFACQLEEHELTHTGEISHRCPDCVNSFAHLSALVSPDQTLAESDDLNHLNALNMASEDQHKRVQTDATRDSESPSPQLVDDVTSDEWTSEHKVQSQDEVTERAASPLSVVSQDSPLSVEKGIETANPFQEDLSTQDEDKPHRCNYCGKRFHKQAKLQNHLHVHAEERPYHCFSGNGKDFSQAVNLKKHRTHHTGQRPYHCTFCDRTFSVSFSLIKHQRVAHPEHLSVAERNRFTCPYCGKMFGQHQDMEQHKRIHTGERPFRCTVCNKSFRQRSVLIVHRKIHTREKPFQCFVCPRRFYGSGDLKTHMETHTGARPHSCPLCSKSFARPSTLQAHMRSHRNKLQEDEIDDEGEIEDGADVFNLEEEEGEQNDGERVDGGSASSNLSAMLSENPGASEDKMSTEEPSSEQTHILTSQSGSSETESTFSQPLNLNDQIHNADHSSGSETIGHQRPYHCVICNKSFSLLISLKRHQLIFHPEQHADTEGKCFPCSYCGRKFGRRQGLLQHERIHTGERPYNCPTCNKSFRQRSALVVHIKTHTGERSFLCFVCSKSFYTPGDLKKHLEIHTGVRPHNCPICFKGFGRPSFLRAHMQIHEKGSTKKQRRKAESTDGQKVGSQEKPFECSHCGKRFSQHCMFKIHQRIHTGERPYKCSQCSLSFRWRRNLISHQSGHPGENPVQCSMCDEMFISEASLKKHQEHHSGISHTCCLCQKTFTQAGGLRKHVRYVHEGERPHKCSECDRGFVKLSDLARHQRRHHYDKGDELFQCSQCERSFSHPSSLVLHRRTHTEEKHECPICSKIFSQAGHLKVHLRTHTKENKPKLDCSECGKSFGQAKDLAVHQRVHTGEKPYQCPQCKKSYRQFAHLSVHLRSHTGEKPYQCPICLKFFAHSSSMKKHLRVMHADRKDIPITKEVVKVTVGVGQSSTAVQVKQEPDSDDDYGGDN